MNYPKNILYFFGFALIVAPLFIVQPKTDTPSEVMLYISAVLGYIGLVFLLIMYGLGSKSVARLLSNDLSQIYKWHSWLGKYGLFLIFLHPIFAILSYGESWLYIISLKISPNFDLGVSYGRIAFFALALVWIFSAVVRAKISYRAWKYIHYLVYAALPLSLLHVPITGSSYMHLLAAKLYYLILLWLFLIFCILRLRNFLNLDGYKYQVISHINPNLDTYILRMKPLDSNYAIDSVPGQYIFLKFGIWSEEHPFSVVDNNTKLTLMFRAFGKFSQKMTNLKPGDIVHLSKAYGHFTNEIETKDLKNIVYIAGGIGVTPFVQRIFNAKNVSEVKLFYCNRMPQTAGLLKQLRGVLGTNLVEIYSDKNSNHELRVKIDKKVLQKNLTDPTTHNYFICGPKDMMNDVKNQLLLAGVCDKQIFTENFYF